MDKTKRYSINNFFKKFFAFLMILFLFFTQNVYAVIDVNNRFLHNSINILSETDYILTINNTSPTDSINANFTHRLPNGVKIADNPNIRNTCGDQSNIQTENDGNTGVIKLINGIIPGVNTSKNGTCKIEIKVLGYSSGNKEAIFNEGELTALTNGQNESNTGNSRSNLNVNHLNNIEIYFNYGVKFQKDGEKNIATIEIRRNPENNSNEDLRIDGIEEFGFDIGQQIRIVGGDQDFIKTNTCGLNVRKEENSGISDRFKNQSNEKMTYVKDGYDSLYFSGDLRGNGGSCQITFEYENNFIGPNFTFDKLVNGNDYTITKRSSFSGHGRESINNYFKLKQPSELIDSSLGINRSSDQGNFSIEFTLNKKKGEVIIEHRLNDENGELLGKEKIESDQGINYSFYEGREENIDVMKDFNEGINENYYEFIGKQGELTGLIDTNSKKILLFYQKKIGNLTVKYLDVDTNSEISTTTNEEKEFGSIYTADQKQIRNYTFVRSQGTTNGVIENKTNEVIFYYEKNKGTVLVKYVDKETNDEISERQLIEKKIGERYTANEKEITNYTYESTTGNKEGEIGENQIEIFHIYTRKIGTISIDIIDKETGKLVETKEFTGKVGDGYNLTELIGIVPFYDFTDFNGGIENTGTYKEGTTKFSVNFTKKKGNVIVRYRNKETGELIEEETFEKNVGEVFNPEQKEFDGYIFVEYIGMINGIVSEDNSFNIVDFYYKRGPGVIFAEFVDESGKKLKDNLEIHGLYGDQYEIKFDVPEGYIFKSVNGELKGKLGYGGLITIIFNKKKDESLGSGPGGYYPVKEDDRVKVNEIKISIIDTKKEEENKVEDNKKEEIITEKKEKEEPIIILGDSIVKEYILDDVREEIEEYRKEQNKIQIKLPKTGVDSDFIKNVEEMISSNEMIHEEDKKEIIDKLLDISYDNDIGGIQNSIEIVLDKDNGKTFYKFNGERVNEDQLNGGKVLEEIPITIVVETDFSKIDNKNSITLQIIGMIIGSILILGTGILIFIRRKKNQ